jgi:hypothetical protein
MPMRIGSSWAVAGAITVQIAVTAIPADNIVPTDNIFCGAVMEFFIMVRFA